MGKIKRGTPSNLIEDNRLSVTKELIIPVVNNIPLTEEEVGSIKLLNSSTPVLIIKTTTGWKKSNLLDF